MACEYFKETFIKRFFYRSVDVHSTFGFLTNQGPLLPHSDNKDLSPFLAVLGLYLSCSWNKDWAEGGVQEMVHHGQRTHSFLSSGKGLQLGNGPVSSVLEFFKACGGKLSCVVCCHPCSSDPHFPGRTKERELSFPVQATSLLP